MVLSENGTKRIIQLDKNGLVTADNYRKSVYNKYSSLGSEHISTTGGELIWCNYGTISTTLDSTFLNSIVWHHTAPTVPYETFLKVTLPASMTLTSGNYLYGTGTAYGTLQSRQSIGFQVYYVDEQGSEYTLGYTTFYGLQGRLRDNNKFEFQISIFVSNLNFSIWSDEFILPNLNLVVNRGRYAI